MALSVVDLYQKVLPRTNCRDCGFATCMAFASMVVSEKLPLSNCPHLPAEMLARYQPELDRQYEAGKWTKKDPAQDALIWARERAASMKIADLPERIGGTLVQDGGNAYLDLPYFTGSVHISDVGIRKSDGSPLDRWEQVFLYNHLAQGGKRQPIGKWKAFDQIPNTVSKVKSMKSHVENVLQERFQGKLDELKRACEAIGGRIPTETELPSGEGACDLAMVFHPLPRIPVLLLFWDAEPEEGFEAKAKLLFDETIVEHLDIESILFLSEHLTRRLCAQPDRGDR
jgi:hypothetical protein